LKAANANTVQAVAVPTPTELFAPLRQADQEAVSKDPTNPANHYNLGNDYLADHHFKEAIDELIGILTQERFKAKLVVILAGYDQEVNQLAVATTNINNTGCFR